MPFYIVRNYPKNLVCDALITEKEVSGLRGLVGERAGSAFVSKKQNKGCYLHEICAIQPVWRGGRHGEMALLEKCYTQSLKLAARNGYGLVVLSLSAGNSIKFPKKMRYDIAAKAIREFLEEHEMTVYLVSPDSYGGDKPLLQDIRRFVKDTYVDLSDVSAVLSSPQVLHGANQEEKINWVETEDLSDAATTVLLPTQLLHDTIQEEKNNWVETEDLSDAATTVFLPPKETCIHHMDTFAASATASLDSSLFPSHEKEFFLPPPRMLYPRQGCRQRTKPLGQLPYLRLHPGVFQPEQFPSLVCSQQNRLVLLRIR